MSVYVLFATDLSEVSDRATPHVRRLAGALHHPVRILHVGDPARALAGTGRATLDAIATRLATGDTPAEVRVRDGIPAREILAELGAGAAAGALSTHGLSGAREILMGSVASKVLRRTPVPLLVVGLGATDRPVRRVLVPVDFSEVESGALSEAIRLATAYDAAMEIVHVAVPPREPLLRRRRSPTGEPPDVWRRGVRADALGRMVDFARARGLTADGTVVEAPRAAPAICAVAESSGADLVIASTHGRSAFERLLGGSVTEEVVQHARLPVLLIGPARVARDTEAVRAVYGGNSPSLA